jgi:diguanylate cyclase (GGDEF)-like protein
MGCLENLTQHVEKAEKLVQQGKLEEGIQEYLQALAAEPGNEQVIETVAELYLRLGQPAKGQECFTYLFERMRDKGDVSKAVLVFRKLMKIGTQEPERLMEFGKLLEKTKPEEAATSYQFAATLFRKKNNLAGALDATTRLAALDPGSSDLQCLLAETASEAGQKDLAAAALMTAAEIQSHQPGRAGEPASILPLIERAYQMTPDDGAVAAALGQLLVDTGVPLRAIDVLRPLAGTPRARPEVLKALGEAYLATGDASAAESALMPIAGKHPDAPYLLGRAAQRHLEAGSPDLAVSLLERVKESLQGAGRGREFARVLELIPEALENSAPFLEFEAGVYSELQEDNKTSQILGRLFSLFFADRNFVRAADTLEKLMAIDPFDAENNSRMQMLNGKLDPQRWQTLSEAFQAQHAAEVDAYAETVNTRDWRESVQIEDDETGEAGTAPANKDQEANVLEDLVLQAEIFMQYGLKPKAVERLERVQKLFPGEEENNEKLRGLYAAAGIKVQASAAGARPKAPVAPPSTEDADVQVDFGHAGEISRNIFRQSNVKNVLFTAVNDIGRTWRVSKCVAALGTVGKTPSSLLEFCATGMKQSDALSLVKLIHGTMKMAADGQPQAFEDAETSPKLAAIAPVIKALGVKSLLVLPMMEGDQQTGMVLLEQCDRRRKWRASEVMVLKSIADQMVMASSHVKLRTLMKSLAVTDERTGMLTRGAYIDCLLAEATRLQQQGGGMCVALVQFGRGSQLAKESGEDALRKFMDEAGLAVSSHLRQNDIAIKYDSTTLALVMPGTKGSDGMQVMEKIRRIVGGVKISERVPPFTYGVVEPVVDAATDAVDSVTELINRAEKALEEAHKEGGNGGKLLAASV